MSVSKEECGDVGSLRKLLSLENQSENNLAKLQVGFIGLTMPDTSANSCLSTLLEQSTHNNSAQSSLPSIQIKRTLDFEDTLCRPRQHELYRVKATTFAPTLAEISKHAATPPPVQPRPIHIATHTLPL